MTAPAGGSRGRGRRRPLVAGVGVAVVYVLAALVTPHLTGRPLHPLFDGFAPPAAYNWVNPPAEFAKDNKKPAEANQDVALGPTGSPASNVTTSDGQAIAGLDNGSVPVHVPDTSVRVQVTPLDPATLGALPAGLRPEGNAYQVAITYQPSGQPVTALAKPGTVALTGAAPVTALLFSPDGKAWQDTGGKPFGESNGLFAQLTAPGYYVSASHNAPRAGTAKGGSGPIAAIAVGAAVVVVAIVVGVYLARRGQGGSRGQGGPSGQGGKGGSGGRGRPPSSGPGSARRRRPGS